MRPVGWLFAAFLLPFVSIPQRAISAPPPPRSAALENVNVSLCATPAPSLEEQNRIEAMLAARALKPQAGIGPVQIGVWFHVITSGVLGQVTPAQLDNQITVLNNSYAGSGFSFLKINSDETDNSAWFTMSMSSSQELAAKSALARDPSHTLNFYVCNPPGGAWAWFPWDAPQGDVLHGVVIPYTWLPGGGDPDLGDGDIAVHEVGHYLGLYHTFQNGCAFPGDWVIDTPYQDPSKFRICDDSQNTCTGDPGNDPVHNFMNYTDNACMNQFTNGQRTRMNAVTGYFRTALYSQFLPMASNTGFLLVIALLMAFGVHGIQRRARA